MADVPGTPIWFELTTPQQDTAQSFYEQLAGWQVAASPLPEHMGYRLASAPDGQGVAGIMAQQEGMPTGWSIYFAADDVDALAGQVTALGGTVLAGPMDIPEVGRFAAVTDPQGVMFNIMRGASAEQSSAFKQLAHDAAGGVGHAVWIELATPDPDAALDFYGKLFGWSKQGAMPMGDMGDYTFIGTEDFRPGAVMSSAATGAPARWNWYIHVPDIDAAVATAKEGGGAALQEPTEIPGGDFSANLTDAQGLAIGIVGPRRQEK